jgi:hypothetical protein
MMSDKKLKKAGWRKIKSAPMDGTHVDLWMRVHASPLSMGMSDEFEVPDSHYADKYWRHLYKGNPEEALDDWYITHWKPRET